MQVQFLLGPPFDSLRSLMVLGCGLEPFFFTELNDTEFVEGPRPLSYNRHMPKYVALLRGINVGGNKKVPMADLKKALEALKYKDVKTLLASGNVVFDAPEKDPKKVIATLEKKLEATFGFTIPVILRTHEHLQKLNKANPFKGIQVTDNTRLYVSFLSEKPATKLKIPYTSPDGNYRILLAADSEVISVLEVTPDHGTIDAMSILEKEFGKKITTRNWNTIQKLLL